MRVCSRLFLDGNTRNLPSLDLGKRLCSPTKRDPRNDRAKGFGMRVERRRLCMKFNDSVNRSSVPEMDTPGPSSVHEDTPEPDCENPVALKAEVEYFKTECDYLYPKRTYIVL